MRLNQLATFSLQPGIVKDDAFYATEGRFIDSDKVRFWRGHPQRLGGWSPALSDTFEGICRGLFAWGSLSGTARLAVGTHTKLYGYVGGGLYEVSPNSTRTQLQNPFITTNGATTVQVAHYNHGLQTGDTATFSGAAVVGGIIVGGAYTVSVVSSDLYEITHSTAATADEDLGGGGVTVDYDRWTAGLEHGLGGGGYGTGGYGTGYYGKSAEGFYDPRTWALSAWGEQLIAHPRNSALYLWSGNIIDRAVPLTSAPPRALSSFVTPERHLVLLGTTQIAVQGDSFDPLLVRWGSRESLTDFEPSATNTARDYKLAEGGQIIAGTPGNGENLVWTDTALYSMRYSNHPYWYTFRLRGTNCGLIGPNAFVTKDGIGFWMSAAGEFFVYDGGAPRAIQDAPIRDFVFSNITPAQQDKIYAFSNPEFNEVGWLYPDAPSLEVNRYILYNYAEGSWSVGTFDRTAWLGRGVFPSPLATATDGTLYFHERGKSADGGPVKAHLETGPMDIGDGAHVMRCDRYVPDIKLEGALRTTLYVRDFASPSERVVDTYTTRPDTPYHDTRFAGRAIRLRFESVGTQDAWRLGRLRLSLRKAQGRR